MGAPMARIVRRAGHRVSIFARTPARVTALVADGMQLAASPAALAGAVDAIVMSLPDSPDVAAVVSGAGGIPARARPGLLRVDTPTVAPRPARPRAALAAPRAGTVLAQP